MGPTRTSRKTGRSERRGYRVDTFWQGPMGLPAKEGIFIQSAKELVKTGTVTDRTYQALDHLLGTQLTIDFVVTVGYYSMLSRLIHSLGVDFDEDLQLNDKFQTD